MKAAEIKEAAVLMVINGCYFPNIIFTSLACGVLPQAHLHIRGR